MKSPTIRPPSGVETVELICSFWRHLLRRIGLWDTEPTDLSVSYNYDMVNASKSCNFKTLFYTYF